MEGRAGEYAEWMLNLCFSSRNVDHTCLEMCWEERRCHPLLDSLETTTEALNLSVNNCYATYIYYNKTIYMHIQQNIQQNVLSKLG